VAQFALKSDASWLSVPTTVAAGLRETEIPVTYAASALATPGLYVGTVTAWNPSDALAGPFPKEFALNTDFSLWHRNTMSPAVSDFDALLTGPSGRGKLAAEGVMPPAAR
jgi:hypothetical protein